MQFETNRKLKVRLVIIQKNKLIHCHRLIRSFVDKPAWLVGLTFWWKMTKRRCVISSSKPFSDAFRGPSGQINIRVFSQSDFILIVIRAKRLWRIQTKTTRQQPTFTFGKCEEMSLGTLSTMNFQLFTEVWIHSQPKRMRPTGALPWKVVRHFFEILWHWRGHAVNLKLWNLL